MKPYFSRAARHRAENAMQRQCGLLENRMSRMQACLKTIDAMNNCIPWIEREPLDLNALADGLLEIKRDRGPEPEFIYVTAP